MFPPDAKRRPRIHYQAMTEFVIMSLLLLMLFSALFMVGRTGIDKLELFKENRAELELKALNAIVESASFPAIARWDYGNDELPMTADDQAIRLSGNEGGSCMRVLNEGPIESAQLEKITATNLSAYGAGNLFVKAAELCVADKNKRVFADEEDRPFLMGTLKALFGTPANAAISENAYWPLTNSRNEGGDY